MVHQRSTIRRMGIAVVLACSVVLPVSVWAAPPGSNPGQPFAEVLAQIVILNDKLDELLAKGVDLRGVTQNWDKKLDSTNGDANGCNSDRFTCLWNNTAVRDNETGIVWERSPNTNTRDWYSAIRHCANREVGGRKGFHLPMREELATLVDTSGTGVDGSGNPLKLTDGHPFQNVQSAFYWTATTSAPIPFGAWNVRFGTGDVDTDNKGATNGVNTFLAWCARGGQTYDGQDVNVLLAP